ncbi:MAG: hypothetical protein JKX72_01095 [Robiginitomaculum sp.]|nr:hypothetical protein [Robiginitomaculum sp.]
MKPITLLIGLIVSGCATTTPPTINVRPVPLAGQVDVHFDEDYQLAVTSYADGKYGLAYTAYKKLLMRSPKETKALLGFADAALAMVGQGSSYQEEAILVYTRLINTPGIAKDILRQANTGIILLQSLSADKNSADIINLATNSDDPRVWNALGRGYDKTGEWISALDAYLTALNLSYETGQTIAPVQNNMGMSLLLQGRTNEAVKKFKQAHLASPHIKLYDNNYRLGLIFVGHLSRAIEDIEDGQAAQLLNDAGFIAAGIGETARARTLYQHAIHLSPVYFQTAEQNLRALG